MRDAIGRYRITGRLGEGGMGLVYEAWDDRLGRPLAVKTIRTALQDPQTRERFWREARAAGALSHPNICHIYEIGEADGELFIAMERLDGESLAERLLRGPLRPQEAAQIALGALAALEAVHARGLLHRDLKPSNVFLTAHGVKLLDFGLARPVSTETAPDHTQPMLTLPGVVLGTPGYMPPEQILGQPIDARSDLYAVGAMLFEMLSGRPPFHGTTPAEILARVLSERASALGGSPAVVAIDRVIQRALARNPDDRYPDAAAMASELRGALRFADSGTQPVAQPIRRLIVLPFRLLRPDEDIAFLAFGLADAIGASLAGTERLAVRSSLAAARYAGTLPDLTVLAAEADVDLVVSGTVLRAGDQIRVTAQLLEAPRGTLLWSHTLQAALTDLFQVQDDLARHIVGSVSASLEGRRTGERRPRGRAHELYLRANQLAFDPQTWERARKLYEEAVAEDPDYAAAWARLGRLYRIVGKYLPSAGGTVDFDRADAALKHALELDPDLSMALTYYAQLELELGRPRDALLRLLERAGRHPSDPHLLAGLVPACRYCGLVDASIMAHEHVRRLDRLMPTSVVQSLFLKGDYAATLEESRASGDNMTGLVLAAMGREEAIEVLEDEERRYHATMEADFTRAVRFILQGRHEEARQIVMDQLAVPTFIDPEGLFHAGRLLARLGDHDLAVETLRRSSDGYCGLPGLLHDAWFDPLRGHADFRKLLDRAAAQRRAAADAFIVAGGERLLGVPAG